MVDAAVVVHDGHYETTKRVDAPPPRPLRHSGMIRIN